MTTINLIPDDVGLQKLRIENRQPENAQAVSHVQGSQAIHQTVGPPKQQEVMHTERRHGDRRHADRRHEHTPVILDTRDHHERRSQHGQRQSDKDSPVTQKQLGIDTEV